MWKFLFVDLDDTLFQTLGKCPNVEGLAPLAYLKDGAVCSYATRRQREVLAMAQREMTVIPATARNRDALARVRIRFDSHAIIDNGGVVLEPDGWPDERWLDGMRVEMARALPGLRAIQAGIEAYAGQVRSPTRTRLIEDFGVPFYVVTKDTEGQGVRLEEIERAVVAPWLAGDGNGFVAYRNGNNLSVLPRTLDKARAVAYLVARLRARHGEILSFGMGDSVSDAAFMAACDYAIVPRDSQFAARILEAR